MKFSEMTIGELAKNAGVGVETVRYYQRLGLIEMPLLPQGGIRRYQQKSLDRMLFIRKAKDLGFSLDEIFSLLQLGEDKISLDRQQIREISKKRLLQIREKMKTLKKMEKALKQLIDDCENQSTDVCCPIIEALAKGSEKSDSLTL
jgi:MerR family mercuric resistance operon transcriptional regulator